MRRALLLCGCLLGAVLAACGGSSSETPWPAEPQNAALGPAGETAPTTVVAVAKDGGPPEAVRAGSPARPE